MSKFKVGEVAIIIKADIKPSFINRECEIVGDLRERKTKQGCLIIYNIMVDGEIYGAFESDLKKKDDDQDTTTWKEIEKICKWSPEGVKA